MARTSEGPWYRAAKDRWFVWHDGRQVNLRVAGEANRADAIRAWHRLMGGDLPAKPVRSAKPGAKPEHQPSPGKQAATTVRELADLFLADARTRLKDRTVGQYAADLDLLTAKLGSKPAASVGPADLSRWLAGMTCGPTTKGIRLRSASACFGWAERMDMIAANPVRKVARPKERSRGAESVIAPEDHARLLAKASPTFRLVLRVLHGTGCRPGEASRITAENFDPDTGVIRLEEHKSDHHGRPRLIFVPPDLSAELRELAGRFGSGPLLRTAAGNPWTGRSITRAMQKLKAAAGVRAMAYGYRHGFATDALVRGLPDAQVAALLGHSSTAMLHKHYSHLTAQTHALRDAVAKVRA